MSPNPPSPTDRSAKHSRESSTSSAKQRQHVPLNPSTLRESHVVSTSPQDRSTPDNGEGASNTSAQYFGMGNESSNQEQNVRSRLIQQRDGDDDYSGPASPRPDTPRSYGSFMSGTIREGFGGRYPGGMGDGTVDSGESSSLLGHTIIDGVLGGSAAGQKTTTTEFLAKQKGVKSRRAM